jgi:hypothetical protein
MKRLSALASRNANLQSKKEIRLKKYRDIILQEVDKMCQDVDVNN